MAGMIKAAGMLLMVAACSGTGFQLVDLYGRRIQQCLGIHQCLKRLLGEIRFHQLPMQEALGATGQAMERESFAHVFQQVANRLEEEGDLPVIWQQELARYEEEHLLGQEMQWLYRLGTELGVLDLEAQVRSLQQCVEQWQTEVDGLRSREAMYGRLCRGIGVCAGVFLALVLW